METNCTVFDYERQVWVNGPEAKALRIRQLTESLNVIEGPRGPEYLRFTGVRNPQQHTALLRRELGQLLTTP